MLKSWPVVYPRIPQFEFNLYPKEMHVTNRFLYITNNHESPWSAVLDQTVGPLGDLYTSGEDESIYTPDLCQYDIAFIDAGSMADAAACVTSLRQQCEKLRIIVVTASPTWQHARKLLQAGASDYIRKPSQVSELQRIIQRALPDMKREM